MPKKSRPTPRSGHVYERNDHPKHANLFVCINCGRRIANTNGQPPQQFKKTSGSPVLIRCSHGEVMTRSAFDSAFETAGSTPPPAATIRKRAKRSGASK